MSSTFPYWFALILSIATLGFYLVSAIWTRSKIAASTEGSAETDFNLGLPDGGDKAKLFAVALVAAARALRGEAYAA